MNGFKKFGKTIVSTVTGNKDDKVAPDDVLLSCRDQLVQLRDAVTLVRSQFTQWAEQMSTSCEAGVELSKIVQSFYSDSDHDGRSKSLQHFCKAQEEIAHDVFESIQKEITNESGVCSELDEWLEAIKQIQSQIEDAERARAAAMTTATRLESLEEQYSRKKQQPRAQGTSLFGGLTHTNEQDLEDLSHKINETKTVKESLSKDFTDARDKVQKQVTRIMSERYVLFDRIYVQILESQHDFYISSSRHVTKFEKAIRYYRKQFPRLGSNNNNNNNSNENGVSHASHASHASRGSRGSRGSFGSGFGSLNNSPKKGTSGNVDVNAFRKKYQSVTDLLDFGDNNMTSKPSNEAKTRDNNKNNSNNPLDSGNNNNNISGNIDNNQGTSNKKRDSQENVNVNNKSMKSMETENEDDDKPTLQKENSFDLMAGFGSSGTNNNINNNSNNNKNNNNKSGQLLQHSKKQQSYFDVWGPLVSASSNGMESLFSDNNNNHNNNNNNTNNNNNNGKRDLMNGAMGTMGNLGNMASMDNMGHSKSAPPKGGTAVTSAASSSSSLSSFSSGAGGVDAGAGAASVLSESGLTSKQKERANRVAQERYEQIQKQFDKEDKEREERQQAFDKHGSRIDEWEYDAKGVRRNLRTLLIKLPDVLWADSGWKGVNLGNLVSVNECKKHYRKAVRLVHPDRSSHRGDSTERKAICERIFEGLNAAWAEEFGKN